MLSTLKFFIRLGITGGIIWVILLPADTGAIARTIVDFGALPFLGAVGMMILITALSGLSWRYVMGAMGHSVAYRWAWCTCWTAMFFSQGLPSTMGGDAVRMLKARQAGLPLGVSISSVIVDRLFAFVALLITAAIGWLSAVTMVGAFADSPLMWVPPVLILCGAGALIIVMSLDRLTGALLPRSVGRWALVQKIGSVSSILRGIVASPIWAPRVLLPAIGTHLVRVSVVFFIAEKMGLDISFYDCLAIVPLALLAAMIPVTVAGWGLREASFVAAFGVLGISAVDAFSLSVLFGLTIIACSLPGGLIWLLNSREAPAAKQV